MPPVRARPMAAVWMFVRTVWPQPRFRMDGQMTAAVLIGLYALVVSAWMFWSSPDDPGRILVADLAPLPLGLAATAFAWWASRRQNISARTRRSWSILTVAFGAFFLGDLVWFGYEVLLNEDAFPSLADVGYLGYYPLLLFGLATLPRALRSGRDRLRFALDAGTILVGGGMVVWYLVLGPTAIAGGNDPITVGLSLGYPLGDLILLYGVAAVSLRPVDRSSHRALRILIVGLLLGFGADIVYGSQSLDGSYTAGSLSDIGYVISWTWLAWAAIAQRRDGERLAPTASNEVDLQAGISVLPYVGILAGSGLTLWAVTMEEGMTPTLAGLLLGSLVLSGFVVTRQVLATRENARLVQEQSRQRSEAMFRALVQNSSDVIAVIDVDSTIRYEAPSVRRIFGYDWLMGARLIDLAAPADRAQMAAFIGAATTGEISSPAEWRLQARDGRWVDVEAIVANALDDPLLEGLVVNMRDITERKALEARLNHAAFHDPLTNLANRALFIDRVDHALAFRGRRATAPVVLFLDLDDFKRVNDSIGHGGGDHVLFEVAERIQQCLRASDTAARLGGDEFAVLLEESKGTDAIAVAERILDAISQPLDAGGVELRLTASIGVVVAKGRDARSGDLVRDADVAMYTAKAAGKSRVGVFRPEMHQAVLDRVELEADLRHALERGELELHYQPIIDLATGALDGVEALLRWRHPVRGLVVPSQFVPIAEETGLIRPIGLWAVAEACRHTVAWRARHGSRDLHVSVNLSPRQLDDPDLVSGVAEALRLSGLPARALVLEITETLLQDPLRVVPQLLGLKDLGLRLAIDDFGTGYSSLSHLGLFPVDILKIDRTFIAALGAREPGLVQGIIDLGRALRLEVVAEGIELPVQLSALLAMGCRLGQGFLFSKAIEPGQLTAILAAQDLERGDGPAREQRWPFAA